MYDNNLHYVEYCHKGTYYYGQCYGIYSETSVHACNKWSLLLFSILRSSIFDILLEAQLLLSIQNPYRLNDTLRMQEELFHPAKPNENKLNYRNVWIGNMPVSLHISSSTKWEKITIQLLNLREKKTNAQFHSLNALCLPFAFCSALIFMHWLQAIHCPNM